MGPAVNEFTFLSGAVISSLFVLRHNGENLLFYTLFVIYCIIKYEVKKEESYMRKKWLMPIFILAIGVLVFYISSDVEKDYENLSIEELHILANNHDAEAQNLLGGYYQYGVKVDVDLEEAIEWYLQSAENGNTVAMVNLGYLYGNGIGTEEDLSKAFEWNLKAAELGNASGMFNVGKKYELGIGVAVDKEQAKYWLEKSEKNKEA